MDRRKSLKALALGSLSGTIFIDACKTADDKTKDANATLVDKFTYDRMKEERERDEKLLASKFFDEHEMATITLLADIIIPADDISGSASQAGVPAFIDFIVQDMPQHQTPMRGGLRWLDLYCLKTYEKSFVTCTKEQQMEVVDAIAYPKKAKPQMAQGVAFFSLMRNLTASGFYTSEIGVNDLGYVGNRPNQWNGVPDEVLKQYNIAYTEKELKECISFNTES
ncbi:MAG TPA: gluconate 2-dehydrogenase subunit 3 family protein [Phnomibacter sp.]|nr:gluconate 2-dehydrogenase subunit 3 family protein [Phnomibacter sp.]